MKRRYNKKRTRVGFKGTTAELNSNVFECFEEQGDRRQHVKTVEALEGNMKKTMKYSAEDLAPLFAAEMIQPTMAHPTGPGPSSNKLQGAIWNKETRE